MKLKGKSQFIGYLLLYKCKADHDDENPLLYVKGCRMGRTDTVSLWYVALSINTRFRFFILE